MGQVLINSTEYSIRSSIRGSGTYLPLTMYTGGSERLRIDTSGNVGIGTSSPDIFSESYQINLGLRTTGTTAAFQISGASASRILLGVGTTRTAQLYSDSANFTELATSTAKPLLFSTNSTERMRIDSSGYVGIGTTTPDSYGALAVRKGVNGTWLGVSGNSSFQTSDAQNSSLYVVHSSANSTTTFIGTDAGGRLQMFCSASASGGVYLANGGTSWTSASDERVKENLEPIQNGLAKVASLRAVTGNYINDETKKPKAFLIAQDVEAVLPEAVDSSNPDELGLNYTDVIPLLVASIKELNAKVDAQAAEIALLKSK